MGAKLGDGLPFFLPACLPARLTPTAVKGVAASGKGEIQVKATCLEVTHGSLLVAPIRQREGPHREKIASCCEGFAWGPR